LTVALCITCFNSKKFLFNSLKYIHQLNPLPDIIYFVENNSTDGTLDYIIKNCKIPYKIIRIWLREDAVQVSGPYDTIAHVRQLGLTAFRHNGCDYGIFLDDDIQVHTPEMIKILTSYPEDIVGGTYLRAYPEGVFVASKWGTTLRGQFRLKKLNEVLKPFDMPLITSGGCMCLSKRLIQDRRLNFYPLYPKYQSSEDYGFCLMARELGYKLILDNTVKLNHEWLRTIKDMKPWTKMKDKYVDFHY